MNGNYSKSKGKVCHISIEIFVFTFFVLKSNFTNTNLIALYKKKHRKAIESKRKELEEKEKKLIEFDRQLQKRKEQMDQLEKSLQKVEMSHLF